jgi:hypothetical protein
MSNTRREFLQSSAALAMGVMGGAATALAAETTSGSRAQSVLSEAQGTRNAGASGPNAAIQVPKMKFGNVEISRMVLGHNQFCGFSHFSTNLSKDMTTWYTQDEVCAVMHRANSFGINAFNYSQNGAEPGSAERAVEDWERFVAEGGKMYLIAGDANLDHAGTLALVQSLKPLALQRHGGVVDSAFREGKMDSVVREWCKRARDLGVMVGVGTHNPKVIEFVEEKGWDVDFYSGCVYNIYRTEAEWKQELNGQIMEMPSEIYMQSDPPRMYKAIRQTAKPCFAFKILAAGRIADDGVAQAFRTAFSSIKPIDGIYVGMYPRHKDEMKENVEIVHRILTGA